MTKPQASSPALHGTLVAINQVGMLISGQSGVGKTSLALQLVDRGHQLIADDLVNIQRHESTLIGKCSEQGYGLIHHKQLGIIDIRQRFGTDAVQQQHAIDCEITLTRTTASKITPIEMPITTKMRYSCPIKHVTLATEPLCNLAVMVEIIAHKIIEIRTLDKKNNLG